MSKFTTIRFKSLQIWSPHLFRTFSASSATFLGHSYNDDERIPDSHKRRTQTTFKEYTTEKRFPRPQYNASPTDNSSRCHTGGSAPSPTKVPRELIDANERLTYPSGSVIPAPAPAPQCRRRKEPERDKARQTAAIAERVRENNLSSTLTAETLPREGKVPSEIRGVDGTIAHPSGFVPPTTAVDFLLSSSRSAQRKGSSRSPKDVLSHTETAAGSSEAGDIRDAGEEQSASSPTPPGATSSPNPRSTLTDPVSASPTDAQMRHKQREAVQRHKEHEEGLMSELMADIFSRGVSASTESRPEKTPPKVTDI